MVLELEFNSLGHVVRIVTKWVSNHALADEVANRLMSQVSGRDIPDAGREYRPAAVAAALPADKLGPWEPVHRMRG